TPLSTFLVLDSEYVVVYAILPFFFFKPPDTTDIYTLSLHDALPICLLKIIIAVLLVYHLSAVWLAATIPSSELLVWILGAGLVRSEEHTSELQSRENLVCRLLLEKKNTTIKTQVAKAAIGKQKSLQQ